MKNGLLPWKYGAAESMLMEWSFGISCIADLFALVEGIAPMLFFDLLSADEMLLELGVWFDIELSEKAAMGFCWEEKQQVQYQWKYTKTSLQVAKVENGNIVKVRFEWHGHWPGTQAARPVIDNAYQNCAEFVSSPWCFLKATTKHISHGWNQILSGKYLIVACWARMPSGCCVAWQCRFTFV